MPKMPTPALRRFRVLYHPTSSTGVPVSNSGGREWSVTVDAASRSAAEAEARRLVGHPCVIVDTERVDDVEPPAPPKKPRQVKPKLGAIPGLVTAASLLKKD